MNKKHVITALSAALLLAVIAAGCSKPGSQADSQTTGQAAAQPKEVAKNDPVATVFAVNTTKAVQGQINDYLSLNGDVLTKSTVDIYADTTGKLQKLTVNVGDRISKDQVIAEVDPSKPGSNFVASPVKSPIAGTVSALPVQVGATITPAVPVARITSTDQVEIHTDVAERFISKIRIGLEAVVRFEAYPDVRFTARVFEVSPVVDPASRTLELKLRFDGQDPRIKAGMFARIKIITDRKANIVKIPAEAMIKRFGDYYVFVVRPDRQSESGFLVDRRKIVPGIQIDNKLEVTSGLEAGEEIVVQGQTLLEDKSKVKVVASSPSLETADVVQ
jgi:membrane fusion protein, multidrug efflux system